MASGPSFTRLLRSGCSSLQTKGHISGSLLPAHTFVEEATRLLGGRGGGGG